MNIHQMSQMLQYSIYVLLTINFKSCYGLCGKEEYTKCTSLADPLLRNTKLIYPDNLDDIHLVCRTWNQFVECVTKYTDLCFNENKKKEFKKAVENPVDLVHQMCNSPRYQDEYLKHATCMRATLTKETSCGNYYHRLVNQVSDEISSFESTICCTHLRFRECVLDETSKTCDTDAYPFAKHILNKTMGFLQQQCINYRPNKLDCPDERLQMMHTGNENNMTSTPTSITLPTLFRPTNGIVSEKTDTRSGDFKTPMTKYEWITTTLVPSTSEYKFEETEISRNSTTVLITSTKLEESSTTEHFSSSISTDVQYTSSETRTTDATVTQSSSIPVMNSTVVNEPNKQELVDDSSAFSLKSHSRPIYFHLIIGILIYYITHT